MNHSRKIIAGLALLAITALAPACSLQPDQPPTTMSGQHDPAPQTSPTPGSENGGSGTHTDTTDTTGTGTGTGTDSTGTDGTDTDSTAPSDADLQELNDDIDTATETTDAFWKAHWSDYFTGSYTAPEVYGAYDGTDPANSPTCGGNPLGAENAFYCPEGDYVAWDRGLMLHSLDVGNPWVYLIVAHEWGHAVQARLDDSLVWKGEELQADCFAGATLYGAAEDGSITLKPAAERQLVDALNDLADETAWTDSSDHGSSFERIDAFDLGRTDGVSGCLPE